MHVLIIKTSSMGDVIHTLPAITDAVKAFPSITFDWVVEENFVEIPRLHPQIKTIIPVAIRRWRKNLTAKKTWTEWHDFREQLKNHYDYIIDAQGLLKSALLSRFAKGVTCGFDKHSAREPLASLFYQRKFSVEKNQHAITRLRNLFSQVLGYPQPDSIPEYGVDRAQFCDETVAKPYLVFLHGTTWPTKHWPEEYWIELAKRASQAGLRVKLLWGNETEKVRAQRIASCVDNVEVLPKLKLMEITKVLANAQAIVGVDTGFGHLAALLNVPTISLYGPTNAALTGALGQNQIHLSAKFPCAPCLSRKCIQDPNPVNPPCFSTLPPSLVWEMLSTLL